MIHFLYDVLVRLIPDEVPGFERIILQGDPAALDFIAYYVRKGRVTAACSIGRNPAFTAFLHLLGEGRVPSPEAIEGGADLAAYV